MDHALPVPPAVGGSTLATADVQGVAAEAEAAGTQCGIATTPAELMALQSDWNALHAEVSDAYVSDSFAWTRLCWERSGAKAGRTLFCAVVRRGSRAVAIWPLVISRTVAGRVAAPLNVGTSAYTPFLVDPSVTLSDAWSAILGEFRRRGDIDALWLPNVRADGPLGHCLSNLTKAALTYSEPAPFLRSADYPDWDSYYARLPESLRAKLRRDRRRLEQLGQVRFEDLSDPAERRSTWEWMIANKRAWLRRRGLRADHLFTEDYSRFVTATLDEFGPGGGRRILALKVNDALVAAELVNVDHVRLEAFLGTFDEGFAKYRPGNLLREDQVRWAFERGLDYDTHVGAEAYKYEWTDRVAQVSSFTFAVTPRGRLFVLYVLARRWLAQRAPRRARDRFAACVRWLRSRAGRR